jgi:hypothetical protein
MAQDLRIQEIKAQIIRDLASAIHYRKLAFKGVEPGGPMTPEFYEKRACDLFNYLDGKK